MSGTGEKDIQTGGIPDLPVQQRKVKFITILYKFHDLTKINKISE